MQTKGWGGLVTNASPYAVPPGAATEQVNLTNAIPGQLSCRKGMLPVKFVESPPPLVDVYPYESNGVTKLIGLSADGEIVELASPAYGESVAAVEPQLGVLAGQIQTSYTRRYLDGSFGDQIDPTPVPPEGSPLTNVLDGNPASAYVVDAESQCSPDSIEEVDGGSSGTAVYRPVVAISSLCET